MGVRYELTDEAVAAAPPIDSPEFAAWFDEQENNFRVQSEGITTDDINSFLYSVRERVAAAKTEPEPEPPAPEPEPEPTAPVTSSSGTTARSTTRR